MRKGISGPSIFVIGVMFILSAAAFSAGNTIYHDGWVDLNKNGKKDPLNETIVSPRALKNASGDGFLYNS